MFVDLLKEGFSVIFQNHANSFCGHTCKSIRDSERLCSFCNHTLSKKRTSLYFFHLYWWRFPFCFFVYDFPILFWCIFHVRVGSAGLLFFSDLQGFSDKTQGIPLLIFPIYLSKFHFPYADHQSNQAKILWLKYLSK